MVLLDAHSGKLDLYEKCSPTGIWICPSTLRKWQFIFSDATTQSMADLTPQCVRWIWQVSYCPRPSTPVQTFWKASAVYTYLFHLFPPKQLECKLRGNPSGESLTHTFQPTGWEDIIDMYVANVDKHFMSPFIHFACLLKKRKSVDVTIPTDTQDKCLCRIMTLKQLNSKHSGSLPLTYGGFLCTGGSSTHDLNECK